MGIRITKAYLQVILSGLLLLALAVLLILQWGNPSSFSFYGKNYAIRLSDEGLATGGVNTGVLMLLSAAGGVAVYFAGRQFLRGSLALWKYRREHPRSAGGASAGRGAPDRSPAGPAPGSTSGTPGGSS
jgi:hypothetical protein